MAFQGVAGIEIHLAYYDLGEHNRAIEDFDRALARARDAALRARIQ